MICDFRGVTFVNRKFTFHLYSVINILKSVRRSARAADQGYRTCNTDIISPNPSWKLIGGYITNGSLVPVTAALFSNHVWFSVSVMNFSLYLVFLPDSRQRVSLFSVQRPIIKIITAGLKIIFERKRNLKMFILLLKQLLFYSNNPENVHLQRSCSDALRSVLLSIYACSL